MSVHSKILSTVLFENSHSVKQEARKYKINLVTTIAKSQNVTKIPSKDHV